LDTNQLYDLIQPFRRSAPGAHALYVSGVYAYVVTVDTADGSSDDGKKKKKKNHKWGKGK
jgi:hypothetical protein